MKLKYQKNYINISRQELLKQLKTNLSTNRYQHVLGVEAKILELAEQYGYPDVEKASIAALLHDYCKEFAEDQLYELAAAYDSDIVKNKRNTPIWHGPAAAQFGMEQLAIQDQDLLTAVSQHTYGAQEMTLLSKLLFVADYIEDNRDFKKVYKARELAAESLDKAVFFKIKAMIRHLVKKGWILERKVVEVYNAWSRKMEE